jgi:hypothetical protein
MNLDNQLKKANELAELTKKYDELFQKHQDLLKYGNSLLEHHKEEIYKKIKELIIHEGKRLEFQINDEANVWSIKRESLEYKANFNYELKFIERRMGHTYKKIEFVVECDKGVPNGNLSFSVGNKPPVEAMEEKIKTLDNAIKKFEEFSTDLKEADFNLYYREGKQGVTAEYKESDIHNYIKIDLRRLIDLIID